MAGMSQTNSIEALVRLEQADAAGSRRPTSASSGISAGDAELYSFLQRRGDARQAESRVLQGKSHPMLALRTRMMRGHLADAKTSLTKLEGEFSQRPSNEQAELVQEKAKLHGLEGNWKACADECTRALSLDPAPVTMLTLYQIRAVALYEQGFFAEAKQDLVRVDSLASIFPESQARFYASVLRLRISAKMSGGSPDAAKDAQNDPQILASRLSAFSEELWNLPTASSDSSGGLGGEFNADEMLTLLRAELELRTDAGAKLGLQALLTFRLAEIVGDRLYRALALLDVWSCAKSDLRALIHPMLMEGCAEFKRVQMVYSEMSELSDPDSENSTSGSLLASSMRAPEIGVRDWKRMLAATHVYVPIRQRVIELSPWKSTAVSKAQSLALETIGQGEISKEQFFRAIWGKQKYAPRLHDPLIWNTIHRLRRTLGVGVSIEEGRIVCGGLVSL
jgi:hypothetical protein